MDLQQQTFYIPWRIISVVSCTENEKVLLSVSAFSCLV
jgi:hypothetical protein